MKDTRGPASGKTAGLVRVSLNPRHWRQTRWLLGAEAAVAIALGLAGLIFSAVTETATHFDIGGLLLTPALGALLLVIGAASAASIFHRRAAKWVSTILSVVAIALVVVSAVAGAHHDPGPFGFTAPAIVFWAVVFCYNLGLLMWLMPDQLEGPAWVPARDADSDAAMKAEKP
jgi:hypothetical protein